MIVARNRNERDDTVHRASEARAGVEIAYHIISIVFRIDIITFATYRAQLGSGVCV